MTRLFMTGLEADHLGVFSSMVSINGGTISIVNTAPRTGTYHLRTTLTIAGNPTQWGVVTINPTIGEVYARSYVQMNANANNAHVAIICIRDNIGTEHLSICVDTTHHIRVTRGNPNGALLAIGPSVLNLGQYYRVEVNATVADAGGICTVRVDGSAEITFVGDTQNGGNALIGEVDFGSRSNTGSVSTWYHDDIVVNDTAGVVNNSWPGVTEIRALFPSGVGTYTQLTRGGVDSGANWSQVEEVPPNDDTDYNYDSVLNNQDTYALSNLGVTGAIKAVNVLLRAKEDFSGGTNVARLLRINATDYQGADRALTTAYAYYQEILETSPDSGVAFTTAELDAMEAGVVVR